MSEDLDKAFEELKKQYALSCINYGRIVADDYILKDWQRQMSEFLNSDKPVGGICQLYDTDTDDGTSEGDEMKYPIYKISKNGLLVKFVGLNSGYALNKNNNMHEDIYEGWQDHTDDIWRDLTDEEKVKYGIVEAEKMRTKETIEKEIEALQKELESLPKGRWRAVEDETYYYIDEFNRVQFETDARSLGDKLKYNSGNYFKTKEEAEKEARHREFEQRVTARFDEFNGERLWSKEDCHLSIYHLMINFMSEEVGPTISCFITSHRNWLSHDKDVVNQIIEEFGAENFLKYVRGEL